MFWKLIILAVVILAFCWVAYGIWAYRERKLEKQRPKVRSQRYVQAKNSMSDYAKKLAEFKSPAERMKQQEQKQDATKQRKKTSHREGA